MSVEFETAFSLDSLARNANRAVELSGTSILVCNADGEIFAVENVCSHQTSPLEGGRVRRCMIFCPLHGMPFDLRTGEARGQLTNKGIRTFPVRITDGMIEIGLGA